MNELFNDISEHDKNKILLELEANTLSFKKNTTILRSISKEKFICLVLDGYLQLYKNNYNGTRTIIEDYLNDSIFSSNSSFISNTEYEMITKEDSKIIIIDLNSIINSNNNSKYYNIFLKNLLKIMTKKNEEMNERIQILTNSSIRNKLLSYFNIMAKRNNSKIIYLPFNFTDLADYLSINRSAMTRELKYLKEEGLIKIDNKKIKLLYN